MSEPNPAYQHPATAPVSPATTKLSATAGPACSAAACPVSVKMPAPITAPMPSVIRLSALSERLSVCSPCSAASCVSVDIGLIRRSLDMNEATPPWSMLRIELRKHQEDKDRIEKVNLVLHGRRRPARPKEINWDAEQYEHKARPCVLGLVPQ